MTCLFVAATSCLGLLLVCMSSPLSTLLHPNVPAYIVDGRFWTAGPWYYYVVDRIWPQWVNRVYSCAPLGACTVGRAHQHGESYEPAVRSHRIGNITVAVRSKCPLAVDNLVTTLVRGISWRPAPESAEAPSGPPWAQDQLILFAALLREVTAILEHLKFECFVMFGAMIGIARHGSLPPWDHKDIDIILLIRNRHDHSRLLQALADAGLVVACAWGGFLLSVYKRDVSGCDADNLRPSLEFFFSWRAPLEPDLWWNRGQPTRFGVPESKIFPLRLASVFHDSGGEPVVMYRAASDTVLDCTHEYDRYSWREYCVDYRTGSLSPCSEMQDKLQFTRDMEVSFAEFVDHYVFHERVELKSSNILPSNLIVHMKWQEYRNHTTHFWADFAFGDCAVLIDVPMHTPMPIGQVDFQGYFSWARGASYQCYNSMQLNLTSIG